VVETAILRTDAEVAQAVEAALRAGEVHGLRRYRRARDWRPLPATVQQRIGGRAIPRQQGHIDALDAMLAAG
jgi:hypothetical protein